MSERNDCMLERESDLNELHLWAMGMDWTLNTDTHYGYYCSKKKESETV